MRAPLNDPILSILHVSTDLRPVLASQYDKKRTDYVMHEHRSLAVRTNTKIGREERVKWSGRTKVVFASIGQPANTRTCNLCDNVGHIARYCRSKGKESSSTSIYGPCRVR